MGKNLLKGPVGKGVKSNGHDTLVVIKLLNKHIQHGQLAHLSVLSESLNGNAPVVVKAIEEFQAKVVKLKKPDGRIDPGGKTIQELKKTPKDPVQTVLAISNIMVQLVQGPVAGVDDALWQAALLSMLSHLNQPDLKNYDLITLVDFRKSIKQKRLWVIDLRSRGILVHTWVAHGQGSGGSGGVPTSFEDVKGSHKSNLGGYVTLTRTKSSAGKLEKMGLAKRGTALVIRGLDPTNKKTKPRQIIFHGASYMNPSKSKFGRSWGCFATYPKDNEIIVSKIQNGSFVYSYAGAHKKP